ncbi:hypothetical protein AAG906_004059 [Vitis piasezkii]
MVKRFLDDLGSFSSVWLCNTCDRWLGRRIVGLDASINEHEKNGKCSKRSVSWALLPSFLFSYFPPSLIKHLVVTLNASWFLLNLSLGMAAESIYKERCIAVDDGGSWAKYMSISGSPDDEYDIISEECLLTVDENREGQAAAFGDDIAIGCLATEFKREIFVILQGLLHNPGTSTTRLSGRFSVNAFSASPADLSNYL